MLLINLFLVLLFTELLLHVLIKPSPLSYGRILGREIPPFKIFDIQQAAKSLSQKEDEPYQGKSLLYQNLTNGDIWGLMQEDAIIGYKPRANAISHNGWWQSNRLGARSSKEIEQAKPANGRRFLLFGDSYTQGWGVPQEKTLDFFLNEKSNQVAFVNFGVIGYSAGQAYLRYKEIKSSLAHDGVVMIFVPTVDLARDINTIRFLAFGWQSYKPNPRFILSGNKKLTFVPAFYGNLREMLEKNKGGISANLKEYLYKYDRFYSKLEYENVSVLDHSIIFKILKKKLAMLARSQNETEKLIDPSSEAMQVTKKIFQAMREDVLADNKIFILLILPTQHDLLKYGDKKFKRKWNNMVNSVCSETSHCLDLMSRLEDEFTRGNIDASYDGTHYGFQTHRIIADEFWNFSKKIFLENNSKNYLV